MEIKMSKQIRDIEEAYKLLKEWSDVSSRLNGDGMVMVKEMARLNVRTKKLIGDSTWQDLKK